MEECGLDILFRTLLSFPKTSNQNRNNTRDCKNKISNSISPLGDFLILFFLPSLKDYGNFVNITSIVDVSLWFHYRTGSTLRYAPETVLRKEVCVQPNAFGKAVGETRTRTACLENKNSTIELLPHRTYCSSIQTVTESGSLARTGITKSIGKPPFGIVKDTVHFSTLR